MRNRSTVLLAAWVALLLVAGLAAAVTHSDEKKLATSGRPGQPTTSSTRPGETTTAPVGQGSDSSASSSDGGSGSSESSGDNPVVDSGNGGGGTSPGRIMPMTGTYTVAISGTSKVNGAPQPVPSSGSYTIRQVNDTDQETTGDFDIVLRWAAESASLVRLTVTQVSKTFQPPDPVLFAPFPGAVGQSWEWTMTSTDNKTTVHQTAQITGTETLEIGGQQVSTFVVQSRLQFSGDLNGVVNVTSWVSPDYRLSVKQHTVTNVQYSLFTVQSDVTTVLVSLTPS